MKLSGSQFKALQDALLSAFPALGDLQQLVRVRVGENLATVAGGNNLTDITRDLIVWAEAAGRLDALVEGAEADRPGNADLKAFAAAYRASLATATETAPATATVTSTGGRADAEPVSEPEIEPERPLVDREEIVSLVTSELGRVNDERHGAALVLVGDSGVGKSRLAERAWRTARDGGMLVLQAQCVGQGAEPLLPLRDALASLHLHGSVEQLLGEAPGDHDDSITFVRTLLSIDDPRAPSPQLGGALDKGVYEGLAKVLLGLARQRGLCVVVEDLTDADPDTLYFLEYLSRKAAAGRLFTVSTVKKDFVEDRLRDLLNKWEGGGWGVAEVPPLQPQHAAEMVSLLWRGPPLAKDQIDGIVAISGGNPFFIEQILNLVADDPALAGSLTDVPPRVQAVLRRRVDRVDEDTRAFLEAAAVALEAGHRLELIAHVAELDDKAAAKLLRRACEAGCLSEDALGTVTFVQELLRRVVYDDIGASARRLMHVRAAEWLEAADLLPSAAHHYERAGRTDELVRSALAGAERAERSGMYRTALQLYERARPFVDMAAVGVRMAKAYVVVGEWSRASEVLDRLPPDGGEVRALRSELCFVRGDFGGALEEMELALQAPSVERVEALMRLGDISLYLGELGKAAEYAAQAVTEAIGPNKVARLKGLLGAAAFFGGDVDEGERLFREAMALVRAQPEGERDRGVYTTILGNLAQADEVRGRWDEAKRLHQEALSLRRTVSDARGELHSLHGVARSELGAGAVDDAERALEDARRLASALGERLEEGKIDHTSASIALVRGDPSAAVKFATAALKRFRESRVAYDVAHARFTLAASFAAAGSHRRAVEEGARARADTARKRFGLLRRLFPDLGFSLSERIEAGLLAYACGDALGLPWEGSPPDRIDADSILSLPAARDWAQGATSDDTALTLLVAEHLVAAGGADPARFIELLAARAPQVKGLGPSTTAAIEWFRVTGKPPTEGGDTNGALMRSLPVGWAVPLDRVEERRSWAVALARTTHPGADASCAAGVGAACAAWALEGARADLLIEVAREEAVATRARCGAGERLENVLAAVAAGTWRPPPSGVTLDPCDTLAAALWCLTKETRLPDALLTAVRIGGDTDTVAALVGGLLGCQRRPDEIEAELPWSRHAQLPDRGALARLADGLTTLRLRRPDG